jgi:hypothetical protein
MKLLPKIMIIVIILILIIIIILVIIFSMREKYMNYKNCIVDGVTYRCDMDKDYPIYPKMKINLQDSRYNRFQIPEGLKSDKIEIEGYYE